MVQQTDSLQSIRVTFEGPDIDHGRVPARLLTKVLEYLQDAMMIVIEDMVGRRHTRGQIPNDIRRKAALYCGTEQGGIAQIMLSCDRVWDGMSVTFNTQRTAIERLLGGIDEHMAGRPARLPAAAIDRVESLIADVTRNGNRIILEGGPAQSSVDISPRRRVPLPVTRRAIRSVRRTGLLLEIDYRDHTAEVWDTQGHVTRIRFSPDLLAQVDAARQCEVVVEGWIETTPSRREGQVNVESIAPVESSSPHVASAPGQPVAVPSEVRSRLSPTEQTCHESEVLAHVQ